MYSFNLASVTWFKLSVANNAPGPRRSIGFASAVGRMYLYGGYNGGNVTTANAFACAGV